MGNYRGDARRQLKRAEAELASGDEQRVKYAALELREAMESLTYDRAEAYKDDFPPEQYETWQPRRVMSLLLEIDPNADKDSTIAFGEEPSPGATPAVMHTLGSEKVLNMKTLKKHAERSRMEFLHRTHDRSNGRRGAQVGCQPASTREPIHPSNAPCGSPKSTEPQDQAERHLRFSPSLRHAGLAGVVGEVAKYSTTASKRLQLAAEGSGDRAGYGRMCRLLSVGKTRGGKGACHLGWADVEEWNDGLIAMLVPDRADAVTEEALARTRRILGDRAYMALSVRRRPRDAIRLRDLAAMAATARVPSRADVVKHGMGPDPRDPAERPLGKGPRDIYIPDLQLGSGIIPGEPVEGIKVKARDFR